jgi:hypothetical protein
MMRAFVGLAMLCAVGVYTGSAQDIMAHPAALLAAGQHDFQAIVTFARGAYNDVPDLHSRMSACMAEIASAACSSQR